MYNGIHIPTCNYTIDACKSYLLTFEFNVQIHKYNLRSQVTSDNLQSRSNISGKKNNLTFNNLNSSMFMWITVNKWVIIKIHITCTNIESICFPGLLENLEGKHNNNYIVK